MLVFQKERQVLLFFFPKEMQYFEEIYVIIFKESI